MVKIKGRVCKRVRDYYHCVLKPAKMFDRRSFRTKVLPKGLRLVVGCPRGKWDVERKRCKVGTVGQKLLRPVK